MHKYFLVFFLFIFLSDGCESRQAKKTFQSTSPVEENDPALWDVISEDLTIEVLAEGFKWAEGPLWVESHQMLLFTDVPDNVVYAWRENEGISVYLSPSGYTDSIPRGGEPGANGLALSDSGSLVLCQHGDRRVAVMKGSIVNPDSEFRTLAKAYKGKRFNSPNDLVISSNGTIYFTDPPYGLEENVNDPKKELSFQGVFRILPDGQVELISDELTRPNGVALTPDETTLIVANSDPDKAYWMKYILSENTVSDGTIFYDATSEAQKSAGSNDGLKINGEGIIFATGPGGIWILNASATLLGRIRLPSPAANCAFSHDEKILYVTAGSQLLKITL
jgi:gluconolactonase